MTTNIELSAKTLSIYIYMLLLNRPVGIREIQKKLGFSTPSLVHYHMNKLVNADLVRRVASKYVVNKKIKVGILKHFITIGSHLIPRYFFYSTFLTTMLVIYLLLFMPETIMSSYIFGLITIILATIFMWTETIILWRDLKNMIETPNTNNIS